MAPLDYGNERSPMDSLALMYKSFDKDFEFLVEGKSVMVHKLILIYRCEYFRRLLQLGTVTKQETDMIFENFDYGTVKAFVRYLYTDKIESGEELVKKLLLLADVYQMLELKRKCEKQLLIIINETNAVDMLIFADKFNCEILKAKALLHIRSNIRAIRNSEEYKKLEELPHLKDSIIDALSSSFMNLPSQAELTLLERLWKNSQSPI